MSKLSLPLQKLMRVRSFAGGLNLRDAALELEPEESPDNWNATLDERGGAQSRLGYAKYNPAVFPGGVVSNIFYWAAGQNLITQAGPSLYKDTAVGAVKTFTTAARVGFADFNGKLCVIHPVDGLFTSTDGTTFTAVADVDAPKGNTLTVWSNKLQVAGNPTNKDRVSWSAAGDPTVWAPTDWVSLREKDQEQVVNLFGVSGQDIQGRPGLLAFKQRSTYRIYDSATGAYETLDFSVGAASSLSVVGVYGRVYTISERGIYSTDGLGTMRPEAEREEPLWNATQIAFDQLSLFAAGTDGNRLYFSVPRASALVNNLAFEYHPLIDWIVAGSNAMSCYTTYLKQTRKLYGGSPTVSGQVYELNKGGSNDGAAIVSRFQTKWFEPADGLLCDMHSLRVEGRGSATIYVRKDFANAGGDRLDLAIGAIVPKYDTGKKYDTGEKYGPTASQSYQDFFSLGTCKAVSFVVEASTTTLGVSTQYLRDGPTPEVGAWAIYGLDLKHVPLGFS